MDQPPGNATPAAGAKFGPRHLVEPQGEHTHTVIMLHGLGSTGAEFAEELFASDLSNGKSLRREFPGCRWVFPSSRVLWSTTFQESMPAWFEARSLTDPSSRQDLQVPGIRESVAYLCGVLDEEITLLGGESGRVVLGGVSQGGAMAMWTFLCYPGAIAQGLCAFVGASTWLPFASDIEGVLAKRPGTAPAGDHREFVEQMMAPVRRALQEDQAGALLRTPVFMGHGSDDAYVDVELGREAATVLTLIGFNVEWRDYSGAEQEGHWLKVPEEMDDIRAFLARAMAKGN